MLSHSCRRKDDERILECKLNYATGSTKNEIMTNLLIHYFPACQQNVGTEFYEALISTTILAQRCTSSPGFSFTIETLEYKMSSSLD